jgi:hypothetical protein
MKAKITKYTSFNELNGKTLKEDDVVIFTVGKKKYNYMVSSNCNFLCNRSGIDNNEIFVALELNEKLLADKVYGYENEGGTWPEPLPKDAEALTRLVLVLFAFCEGEKSVYLNDIKKYITLEDGIDKNDNIKRIGDYRVEVGKYYTMVGCTKVTFEQVKKVYNKMLELQK